MTEFRKGDVVIYKHVKQGNETRNGSLGIATGQLDDAGDPFVKWLMWTENDTEGLRVVYAHNLEKVGHIELP